jgi:chemotaxis family two-component system sensor histidine kinase/response regulator PixL
MAEPPPNLTIARFLGMTTETPKCVLLVEDDRSVRRYLEVTLQRAGYKVITAEDGLEGMRCALTSKVDVVLTDAVMPQMNGRELARFLRSNPKLAKLPIVLLTGQENDLDASTDQKLIDAILYKPVKAEELMKCLASVVTVSEARP